MKKSIYKFCSKILKCQLLRQVRNKDDVLTCARHMHTDSLAPVFLTSSVTGEGLELVRLFYNLLPQRHKWSEPCQAPGLYGYHEALLGSYFCY